MSSLRCSQTPGNQVFETLVGCWDQSDLGSERNSNIKSHEEYLSCRNQFETMYPRYSAVDARLKQIASEFSSMAVKLDAPQCPPAERRKIQQQVKELYAQVKPEVV